MRERILHLLASVDGDLVQVAGAGGRLDLYPIGRGSIVLFHGLSRGSAATRDLDVLQVGPDPGPMLSRALERFGAGSEYARVHGLYLEAVNEAYPPVPTWYVQRSREYAPGRWAVLRVWQMEVHDLVITKLRRFSPKDRADVQALCDQGLLEPAELRRSLEKAFPWSTEKNGEPDDPHHAAALDTLGKVIGYLEGRVPRL